MISYNGEFYAKLLSTFQNCPINSNKWDIYSRKITGQLYVYYDYETIKEIVNTTKTLWFKNIGSYLDREENKYFFKIIGIFFRFIN